MYKFYFFLYTNYSSVGSWLDIVVGVIRHDVGMMLKNLFWPFLLMIQIQLIFVYLYVGIENLPLVVRDKIGSFRFHIHNIFWNRFKRFSQWYECKVFCKSFVVFHISGNSARLSTFVLFLYLWFHSWNMKLQLLLVTYITCLWHCPPHVSFIVAFLH